MPESVLAVSAAAGGLGPRDAALVRKILLFQRLSDQALRSLLAETAVRPVARGATLFLQDEPADRFYVLLDGWVKLYRLSEQGAEAIVNIIAPGETFAEAAMFANAGFSVCAAVVADARVLTLTAQAFARSLAEDLGIAFVMLGSLSLRLRQLVQQIEQLQVKSAPQRVADFLLRLCPPDAGDVTVMLPFKGADRPAPRHAARDLFPGDGQAAPARRRAAGCQGGDRRSEAAAPLLHRRKVVGPCPVPA